MATAPNAPIERRAARFLIDHRFQLKYATLLVSVAVALLVGLGLVVAHSLAIAAEESRVALAQAESALREAQTSQKILTLNSMADDERAVKALEEIDRKHAADLAQVRERAAVVDKARPRILMELLGVGVVITLVLLVTGIYITRKVVAPAVRMQRLLRKVGTGRLVVNEQLNRGDELTDLFDTFLQMTHSLRALQSDWVASLDEVIELEQAAGARAPVRASLLAVREQLSRGLRDREPPRDPGPRVSKPHPLLEVALQRLVAQFEANDYGVSPILDLGTLVANADGTIDAHEVEVLRFLFQESLGTRLSPELVDHLIKSSLEATSRTNAAQRARLVTEILLDCDAVDEGLTVALAVAFASEGLSPTERELVASMARQAGLPSARFDALIEQVRAWDIRAMIAAVAPMPA